MNYEQPVHIKIYSFKKFQMQQKKSSLKCLGEEGQIHNLQFAEILKRKAIKHVG